MISFDKLPNSKHTTTSNKEFVVPAGLYKAKIKSAEIINGPNGEYCNLCLTLFDKAGKEIMFVYDIIKDVDKPLLQYKLQRLLVAVGLAKQLIGKTFELKDIAKVLPNKEVLVDIKTEDAKNGYSARSIVDIFKAEIYYPVSEAAKLFAQTSTEKEPTSEDGAELPFDLSDNTIEDTIQADDAKDADLY